MPAASRTLIALLYEVLGHQDEVVIRRAAILNGDLGVVRYPTNTATIRRTAPPAKFAATLARQLVHLHRGPALSSDARREADIVDDIAARHVVPTALVRLLRDGVTAAELANALGIDVELVQHGLRLASQDELPPGSGDPGQTPEA